MFFGRLGGGGGAGSRGLCAGKKFFVVWVGVERGPGPRRPLLNTKHKKHALWPGVERQKSGVSGVVFDTPGVSNLRITQFNKEKRKIALVMEVVSNCVFFLYKWGWSRGKSLSVKSLDIAALIRYLFKYLHLDINPRSNKNRLILSRYLSVRACEDKCI